MKQAKKRNTMKLATGLSVLALGLISSHIATAAEPGWYVGLGVGESRADIDGQGFTNTQLNNGFTNIRLGQDEDDTAYKAFGGYQFNRFFALEGGYFDLGKYTYGAIMDPASSLSGTAKVRGFNLDLVGLLPLSERMSAFGRAGTTYVEHKNTYRGSGQVVVNPFGTKDRESGGYKFGVGLQYDINPNLSARLEGERYDIDNNFFGRDNIDVYSASLVYRFGSTPPPAPAPVAAAPRPTPPPAPAPAPQPVRVSLATDTLFDFDRAELKPEGRAELDKLATDLRGVEFDTIQVTGYTDRIGSQAYNLNLSNRRAQAVKDYLVRTANIPAAKISTRGLNGSDPVTSLAQCSPQLPRAQLIACLAPDRRVEVEVNGSRPR